MSAEIGPVSRPGRARLAFVLVVHQEQAYVDRCVRSMLAEGRDDVEVIVVDIASTDHAQQLLTELAAADPRVVLHRLEEPVPLGSARATGLAATTADFVWFVDTVDQIEPGAVTRVLDVLDRRAADVLLVDYTVVGQVGVVPSPTSHAVAALVGRRAVDVHKRPDLLDHATATWALVMRRQLLTDWGISPGGGRSEVSVGYCALLAADKIAAVPGLSYRRSYPPNMVRRVDVHGSEADLLEEFARVLGFVDAHRPRLDDRRPVVAGRMVRAATQRMHRLPASARREYARRLVALIRPWSRADDLLPPGRLASIRMRLVRGGHPALYRVLERTLQTVRAVLRRGRRIGGAVLPKVRRGVMALRLVEYRLYRMLPLKSDLAVFAAYWYRGYSCNPRAIYEAMRELAPHLRGVWVVERGTKVPPGVETVRPNSRAYFKLIARAGYFVNNVNFPDHLRKRRGSVHVQTHHGTPLKRMGLDLRDAAGAGQRINFRALLRRCATWDYSLTSNRLSTLVWERVYPLRYQTLEYGYPRNDVLARATAEDVAAARASLDIADGQRVLLYAPTHREYERGFRSMLDTVRLAESLGEEWVVLSRAHYFYDVGQPVAAIAGRVIDVTSHGSIEQLCLAADLLVTDYSSVMFDYGVLDRPILIYAPDWETYRSLRGTYFDLLAEPPGVVCRTPEEVTDAIVTGAYISDVAGKARRAFRSRFCAWDDGHASERVVRRVFLGETPPLPAQEPAA